MKKSTQIAFPLNVPYIEMFFYPSVEFNFILSLNNILKNFTDHRIWNVMLRTEIEVKTITIRGQYEVWPKTCVFIIQLNIIQNVMKYL